MILRRWHAAIIAAGGAGAPAAYAETAGPAAGAVSSQIMSLMIGMALVLAAIAACAWLLKRLAPRSYGDSGALRVIAGTAVGQRERVVIVEIGTTWLVLGVAPGNVNALHQMPRLADTANVPAAPAGGNPFAAWMKQMREKRGDR